MIENKYYNEVEHNLSSRELIKEIKSNSYEWLIDKPSKIELIQLKENINLIGRC